MSTFYTLLAVFFAIASFGVGVGAAMAFWSAALLALAFFAATGIVCVLIATAILCLLRDAAKVMLAKLRETP